MASKIVNKEEAVEIVKDYVRDVFGSLSGFFLSNIVKEGGLWVVEGKIFMNLSEIKGAPKQLAALTKSTLREKYISLREIEKKEIEKNIEKMVTELRSTSFCFYLNSYGKICAFHIAIPNTDIPFIPQYCNEVEEKDLKDYCLKAKNFIEKGTTFRSFDFIPLYGWYATKDKGKISSIVIFYSLNRTILVPYMIEVAGDEVDLKMIEEPTEIDI